MDVIKKHYTPRAFSFVPPQILHFWVIHFPVILIKCRGSVQEMYPGQFEESEGYRAPLAS